MLWGDEGKITIFGCKGKQRAGKNRERGRQIRIPAITLFLKRNIKTPHPNFHPNLHTQ